MITSRGQWIFPPCTQVIWLVEERLFTTLRMFVYHPENVCLPQLNYFTHICGWNNLLGDCGDLGTLWQLDSELLDFIMGSPLILSCCPVQRFGCLKLSECLAYSAHFEEWCLTRTWWVHPVMLVYSHVQLGQACFKPWGLLLNTYLLYILKKWLAGLWVIDWVWKFLWVKILFILFLIFDIFKMKFCWTSVRLQFMITMSQYL